MTGVFENELVDAFAFIALLLPAIIFHEVSHGAVALQYGDPTARDAGRLTLNPIPHIDPFGSIIFPAILALSGAPFLFGWAKPVPVRPRYFAEPRRMMAVVGVAGPLTNLFLAWAAGIVLRVGNLTGSAADLIEVFAIVNVLLAVFNMLPLPPLDGSRLLPLVLTDNGRRAYARFEQYGLIIILGIMFLAGGLLFDLIRGPIDFLLQWVVGL